MRVCSDKHQRKVPIIGLLLLYNKNRGEMMSKTEPGIMFDATNSWNGYNHQGKIALWYAIKKICELIDPMVSPICNQKN